MTNKCLDRLQANANKSAVIVEFIGSFLIILTIPLSQINNAEVSPLAIGHMFMVVGFTFGYLSGSHFNPAVSIAVFLANSDPKFGLGKLILYIIAQCAAGVAAVFYVVMIHGTDFPTPMTPFDLSILKLFATETIFSFAIINAVLHCTCAKMRHTAAFGFAVGMPVVASYLCVGGIHGGAFNPAAATGLLVVRCLTLYCYPLLRLWVYWGAEVLAALLAAIVFRATVDAASRQPATAYGNGIAVE